MLEKAIQKAHARLQWRVVERRDLSEGCGGFSRPHYREHILRLPPAHVPVDGLELLSKLCTMWLAENVHHLFSTHIFARETPESHIYAIQPVLDAANDWFSDYQTFLLAPDEVELEFQDCLEIGKLISVMHDDTGFGILTRGLMAAEARLWFGRTDAITEDIRPVAEIFLRYPPAKPDIANLELLINQLLIALDKAYQVRRIIEDDLEVWKIDNTYRV